MYVIILICIIYIAYLFIAAYKVTEISVHPKGNSYQQEIKVLKEFGYDCEKFLSEFHSENFTCKSKYGYDIHGRIFRLEGSNKAVVLCHGYGGNSTTMFSYARVFRELGYSTVVYDHRNFGINDKSFTSFGYFESKDLIDVFEYVKKLFPEETVWGVMGESMGASTMLMALPEMKGLSFAIDDCGYSDMKSEIRIKDPLPSLGSVSLCNLFMKSKYGFSMKEVQPYLNVKKISSELPMLFIYSKTDQTVPFYMFEKIYSNKPGKKDCWIIEDCRHAKAIFNFTSEYKKRVGDFLDKNNL